MWEKEDLVKKITSDGSLTVFSEKFGQTYHSIHGAKTESQKVFIELGFQFASAIFKKVKILEIGFGTGLNAFLTEKEANRQKVNTSYTAIEAFPISDSDILADELVDLNRLSWNGSHKLSAYFEIEKINCSVGEFETSKKFNLIYFDAFSPEAQPELWTSDVFGKMFNFLEPKGVLTTYCSKSLVRKNMLEAGFKVEKHKGPPHKREVIRALKN